MLPKALRLSDSAVDLMALATFGKPINGVVNSMLGAMRRQGFPAVAQTVKKLAVKHRGTLAADFAASCQRALLEFVLEFLAPIRKSLLSKVRPTMSARFLACVNFSLFMGSC